MLKVLRRTNRNRAVSEDKFKKSWLDLNASDPIYSSYFYFDEHHNFLALKNTKSKMKTKSQL